MVTHDAHAAQIADRILFLADGLIVKESTGRERARDPRLDGGDRGRVTRFALKGMLGRKLRTVLTALAIVLGVAMVSGTFVLTDSIDDAFNPIFTDVYRGTDATITGKTAFDLGDNGTVAPPFDESLLAEGQGASGHRRRGRRRRRRSTADRLRREGDRLRRRAEPRLQRRPDAAVAQQPRARGGRWPADGEVVIDKSTAGKKDLKIGQKIGVQAEGPTSSSASRASSSSARSPRSAAPRWPGSTCRPRSISSTSRASSTRSASRRRKASRPTQLVAEIQKILPRPRRCGRARRRRRRTHRTRTSSSPSCGRSCSSSAASRSSSAPS